MIQQLWIQNYAIIEEVDIQFSTQLTTITGETGAGKSIIMGALGLILGERADTKVLYHKDQKCIVEGTFHIESYQLKSFFEQNDLDYDPECIIRREINPSGKSRAFINDTPTRLSVLKKLSNYIIDLHGGVLSTYVEIIKAMSVIVNDITIEKTGTINSTGFQEA